VAWAIAPHFELPGAFIRAERFFVSVSVLTGGGPDRTPYRRFHGVSISLPLPSNDQCDSSVASIVSASGIGRCFGASFRALRTARPLLRFAPPVCGPPKNFKTLAPAAR
jgi:hypothetical protein